VGNDGGGDIAFDALVADSPSGSPLDGGRVDPEQGFVVLNTSGTTGLPKGVVESHRAMVNRTVQVTIDYGPERGDRYPD
jgi:acyl-coenzyme A synthetase/AMP-(fatty) acid ligase